MTRAGAAGLLVLRFAGATDGYPCVAASLFLVGGGMGFAMSPLTVVMIRALPRSKQGVASAINSTARELGGALGVAPRVPRAYGALVQEQRRLAFAQADERRMWRKS